MASLQSQTPSEFSESGSEESTPNHPSFSAAMKERLQTSARDLMRSMEQAIGRSGPSQNGMSLESTLRAVFSSCTSGAQNNVTSSSEANYSSEEQKTETRDRAVKSDITRVPFQSHSYPAMSMQQKEMGEHIYAQLFFDDQVQASKAVNALRKIETSNPKPPPSSPVVIQTRTSSYTARQPPPPDYPHKTFPAAWPTDPRQQQQQHDLGIQSTNTFDDSISAISAHTLEAMARAAAVDPFSYNPSFPREIPTFAKSAVIKRVDPSPIFVPKEHDLARPYTANVRIDTIGDEHDAASKQSQSTKVTTDTSSFDNWQREDTKYWADEAMKDQRRHPNGKATKQRSPSHGDSSRRTRSTTTTMTSSGRGSLQHPHDSISGDLFFNKDPATLAEASQPYEYTPAGSRLLFAAAGHAGEI